VEIEPRTTAPAHATGAVEFVALAAISDDATFRLRDEGDVAPLAASIARRGLLVPLELRPLPGAAEGGPRFQLVAGFRRVAALQLLARDRVLARVHAQLEDEDAWGIALGQSLLAEPLLASEIEALRVRLADTGAARWAEELLEDALARAPVDPKLRERFRDFLERTAAEGAEECGPGEGETLEVTPEELAADLAARMFETNQDLSVAFESWAELPLEGRRMIVEQARYVQELLALLERDGR
jgi:hypothetical protein